MDYVLGIDICIWSSDISAMLTTFHSNKKALKIFRLISYHVNKHEIFSFWTIATNKWYKIDIKQMLYNNKSYKNNKNISLPYTKIN